MRKNTGANNSVLPISMRQHAVDTVQLSALGWLFAVQCLLTASSFGIFEGYVRIACVCGNRLDILNWQAVSTAPTAASPIYLYIQHVAQMYFDLEAALDNQINP